MLRTSEYVTIGHPDKVADFITSYVLDRYMEKDPGVRYAVEVQVKDSHVTLGGEVTSAYEMGDEELKRHVRDAICSIGYTPEYAKAWGAENCIDPDNLDIAVHIGRQSPDIAQGVDADGWGDQGIFWGMATSETAEGMPLDYALAKRIGDDLYKTAKGDMGLGLGLDIKTQVTVEDGKVEEIVIAIPTKPAAWAKFGTPHFADIVKRGNLVHGIAEKALKDFGCASSDPNFIINGTGAYVRHASAGDCGTTGRKLAVDFYGGNCRIGGGAPWSKDPTKADVTLNVYARKKAVEFLKRQGGKGTVFCSISCCIGRKDIRVAYQYAREDAESTFGGGSWGIESRPASEIIAELGLKRPVFARLCREGLFATIADEGV